MFPCTDVADMRRDYNQEITSGGVFGVGRAGWWMMMQAAQESEPEGSGGRATHRYKTSLPSRLPLLTESTQDFSTARITRPTPPPLLLHHFSDAEEEEEGIEKVE